MIRKILLLLSHVAACAVGFALGIYMLPILMAPESPSSMELALVEKAAEYGATFQRDLKDSDFLHWGEGTVHLSDTAVVFQGKLAPGPDYRLYLSPEFVETEAEFLALKAQMRQVGSIDTFDSFMLTLPDGVRTDDYRAVIVWCESFSQFITAAQYR